MLKAVSVLDQQMECVNTLTDAEIALLEEYRTRELNRLEKQRAWLLFHLEAYARSTGEKTIRLPYGSLKLRKGKDRVAIVSIESFLPKGQLLGLIRQIPESNAPDVQAILAYIKRTGDIPPGTEFIQGDTKFSYSTNNGGDHGTEAESGVAAE
jgi:hypothetical protein